MEGSSFHRVEKMESILGDEGLGAGQEKVGLRKKGLNR